MSLAFLLALAACRHREPDVEIDAQSGTPLRVATFNVRRFFDTVCESGLCGVDDYEAQPSAQAFDARAKQLADAIRLLGADVISLQEIETQACLDALLAQLIDTMPYGVLGETDAIASVDVAVLSKAPLDMVIGHRDTELLPLPLGGTTTFSRELLEVHTRATNGVEVILFAAHFKAKSDDDPPRRLAEAQVSARIVTEVANRTPAAIVLLAGDLNDTPGSPPLDALTVSSGLLRLADDLPVAAQATYFYRGQGQSIDHILLAPTGSSARAPRSSRTWRDSVGWGGSDHSALTSELLVPDAR